MKDFATYHLAQIIFYYKKMWLKCVQFNDRATRSEFWYAYLAHAAIGIIVYFCLSGSIALFVMISRLYALASFIPFLALTARRLHDVGKPISHCFAPAAATTLSIIFMIMGIASRVFIVLGGICLILSLVTWAYLIYLLAQQGVYGDNQYGADPRQMYS